MVRFLSQLVVVVVVLSAMAVTAVAAAKRLRTGTWSLPSRTDYNQLKRVVSRHGHTPKIIYLHRGDLQVTGGFEDSHENRSQLIPMGETRILPRYTGTTRSWNNIIACVKHQFAAYDVEITDRRPDRRGYVLVQVGGTPADFYGTGDRRIGGLAPFNGDTIADPIVFVFSRTLDHDVLEVCETVAHEVGHIYGLDHSYRYCDLMTYINGCKRKRFMDIDTRCGEYKRRDCLESERQNSYARLMAVLGPRRLAPLVAAR